MKRITVFVFLILSLSLSIQQVKAFSQRKVALLDLTARNGETGLSRIRSCRHILQTAGLPYLEISDVVQAIQYPVIFISPVIYSYSFTSSEKALLTQYVNQGGVLIASSLRDPALFSLFGVTGYTNYTDISSMTWDINGFPQYFDRFDDPNEITIALRGASTSSETFTIRPYNTTASAQNLATLNNGTKALIMNTLGQGRTFLFAIDLRDVIIRNQINSDINAQRSYSNGFEPTSDAFIFFISNVITHHIPHIPRVHTCPDCESSAVMITHDIDSRTSMDTMSIFIDYEEENNLNAMYNVTTRIYNDEWMSDFYIGSYEQVEYAKLHGQKLASHSLGHFIDFADFNRFPLGTLGNTPSNYMPLYVDGVTSGGSVFGETEVSKYLLEQDHGVQIKSFRAGHLAYNKRLPKALTDLGYLYNSTFSANDVLTNFPFYTTDNLSFSGQQMPVLEIPMTISDAAGCCPFTAENALERAALWAEVALKNNNNGAPTVLLVHPNRGYKLPAQQLFVNAMPSDVKFMFLDDFGDFWKKRETANVSSTFENDTLIVAFAGFEVNTNLSLVIKNVDDLQEIKFFDAIGQELFPESVEVSFNETRYCHFVYGPAVEICNGLDDDGDGEIDEEIGYTQFRDEDQDGYGDASESINFCQPLQGYVLDATDCNDESTVVHPNNVEYCDQLDNNCNDIVDEGLFLNMYYWDADNDGFGNDNVSILACVAPLDYIMQNGDCNDEFANINPAQLEVCNDLDDNCNDNIDEGLAFVEYYEDLDADGFGNSEVVVTKCILPFGFVPQHGDCNDNHFATNPSATEDCDDDEDNDCDAFINEDCVFDVDEDGFNSESDCNDENNLIFPGAEEICENALDEDCDGVDEICPILGCTDSLAFNYNAVANLDDGSCIPILLGCTNSLACNFDETANTDNGGCILPVPEVCNNVDDNCNNEIDEGLSLLIYYTDWDGDGQGSGDGFSSCNSPGDNFVQNGGDCDDNNVSVNALSSEICDLIDNNCNGLINEGLNPTELVATNVNTALFPSCTSSNIFSANFNNGVNSVITVGDGPDLWYKLIAQHNTLRVGLSAASGNNSLQIYRENSGCLQLVEVENELSGGSQTLLTDDLEVGATYYVVAHQISAPTNPSAKVCFNHLLASSCDHVYSNNSGVYSNVCTSFKAQFRANASNYIFNVLEAMEGGNNLNVAPWSYITPSNSSIITRIGTLLPANLGNLNIVYTLNIPVIYNLADAVGNVSSLTANPSGTCTVTLQPEALVTLRSIDRCPAVKMGGQMIATDRSICGTARYEWEFTQVLPTAQPALTVLGGLNTTSLLLSSVPGMGNGKTYNVRVRPIHSSGKVGNYGLSQCLKTSSSGMMLESNNGNSEIDVPLQTPLMENEWWLLYPNPSQDGRAMLSWKHYQEGQKTLILRDVHGRVIMRQEVVIEGNFLELDWKDLDAGVYLFEVDGMRLRWVKS